MQIQTTNILNILLPQDNKFIKETLQKADFEQISNYSKSNFLKDVLTNLFKDIISGTKSNETILNILKNSNLFSDIKKFSQEIKTLQNLLSNEPKLQKFQAKIENFMLNITKIDEDSLKKQIDNSGVFLESKIRTILKPMEPNLANELNELQSILTNVLKQKNGQNINNQLTNKNTQTLLSNSNEAKYITANQQIQNVISILKDINNLINQIILHSSNSANNSNANLLNQNTNLINALKLVEDIIEYNNGSKRIETAQQNIKQLFSNILNFIQKDIKQLEKYGQKIIQDNQIQSLLKNIENFLNKDISNSLFEPNNQNRLNQFFENKVSNDMKAVLLQLQKELVEQAFLNKDNQQELLKNVDKLLFQIDYHQLLSIASNSNSLYLPFLWDLLEDGKVSMGKDKNEKFYCQINLKLKEDGKIDLLVALEKKEIEITMHIQQDKFKKYIQSNIQQLRQSILTSGLNPTSIKIYDLKEEDLIFQKKEENNFFKNELNDINLGLDIRIWMYKNDGEKIDRAIALKYKKEENNAPKVIAGGRGEVAKNIIKVANDNNVPIKKDEDLVELLSKIDIDKEIPPTMYKAVAKIFNFIYSMTSKKANIN